MCKHFSPRVPQNIELLILVFLKPLDYGCFKTVIVLVFLFLQPGLEIQLTGFINV